MTDSDSENINYDENIYIPTHTLIYDSDTPNDMDEDSSYTRAPINVQKPINDGMVSKKRKL